MYVIDDAKSVQKIAQRIAAKSDGDQTVPGAEELVVHTRRPQWGVAILTKERRDRRWYQFQDGRLRKFKDGFFHLFAPVQASDAVQQMLIDELKQKHGLSLEEKREQERFTPKPPVMSFEEQIRVFLHLYPGGFAGAPYREEIRARPTGRQPKRMIDPAIAAAMEAFEKETFETSLKLHKYHELHDALVIILKGTSLASPSKVVKPILSMPKDYHERLTRAFCQLLYGEGKYGERFRQWLMALDANGTIQVTWPMATVLPALVQPNKHVCVARRVFHLQARLLLPNRPIRKLPSPRAYRRALKLSRIVQKQLLERGLKPADLFDVRQFIWETLRPKGQQQLAALKAEIGEA